MGRNFAITGLSVFGVAMASPAFATITVTQGASAPTYDTVLTFDEPGTPTGIISADAFQADYGIIIDAGDGVPQVDNWEPIFGGWGGLGDANSFFGNFGIFMTWDNDLTALSIQVWDPSGPPSPFGGGMGIFIFNDGVEIASSFATPAWGGIGDEWFDIVADGGDVFDEVRILGFGFPATTFGDNLSWNAVASGVSVDVDVKPGSCPNSFNRNSNGVLPVAILGTMDFDVTTIDVASITISRADGVGGSVGPNNGPPGPSPSYDDVATPFDGEECDCHEEGADGNMDLMMHFNTAEVVDALDLGDLAAGDLVSLVISGSLLDGTAFSGGDCVRLVPPGTGGTNLVVGSTVIDAWVDAAPLDLTLDGGGYATYNRTYPIGTQVTLTAPPVQSGRQHTGWMIDGVFTPGPAVTVELVEGINSAIAIYRKGVLAPSTRSGVLALD